MTIKLFLVLFLIYENVVAVEKLFKGPFSSDDAFDEEVPFNDYVRFTLFSEEGNVGALQLHVIMLKNVEGRTAIRDSRRLWEDGVVPYTISNKFGVQRKYKIHVAINEFHIKTCARFVPHSNEKQYLLIGPGKGCSSNIGKTLFGLISETRLRKECFVKPGTVIHELMHILGFVHEHNRPDRDNYVRIIEKNVMNGYLSQFEKYTWKEVQSFNYSYDYGSVMHYGPYFFSKNKTMPTIVALEKGAEIGQRRGFSEIDILKINELYKCYKSEYLSSWNKEEHDADYYT